LHDHLPFVQTIAFSDENFLDTPAEARAHMGFVHFDRAGDGVPSIAATGNQQ
jgi:hypothetical protein